MSEWASTDQVHYGGRGGNREKNAENFECPVTQSLMVFDGLKFCRSFLISRSFSCCKLNDIVCLGNSRRSPALSSADGV